MQNIKSRDVIIGFIVLLLLILSVVWVFNNKSKQSNVVPISTPSVADRIKDKFNGLTIPDDVNKVELKDATGGDALGISTETEVLADLPELSAGEFYQVWENREGKYVSLGKMRVAKGGYLYEGNLKSKQVIVSREKIFDNNLEVKILE